jgi:hypothetical protein
MASEDNVRLAKYILDEFNNFVTFVKENVVSDSGAAATETTEEEPEIKEEPKIEEEPKNEEAPPGGGPPPPPPPAPPPPPPGGIIVSRVSRVLTDEWELLTTTPGYNKKTRKGDKEKDGKSTNPSDVIDQIRNRGLDEEQVSILKKLPTDDANIIEQLLKKVKKTEYEEVDYANRKKEPPLEPKQKQERAQRNPLVKKDTDKELEIYMIFKDDVTSIVQKQTKKRDLEGFIRTRNDLLFPPPGEDGEPKPTMEENLQDIEKALLNYEAVLEETPDISNETKQKSALVRVELEKDRLKITELKAEISQAEQRVRELSEEIPLDIEKYFPAYVYYLKKERRPFLVDTRFPIEDFVELLDKLDQFKAEVVELTTKDKELQELENRTDDELFLARKIRKSVQGYAREQKQEIANQKQLELDNVRRGMDKVKDRKEEADSNRTSIQKTLNGLKSDFLKKEIPQLELLENEWKRVHLLLAGKIRDEETFRDTRLKELAEMQLSSFEKSKIDERIFKLFSNRPQGNVSASAKMTNNLFVREIGTRQKKIATALGQLISALQKQKIPTPSGDDDGKQEIGRGGGGSGGGTPKVPPKVPAKSPPKAHPKGAPKGAPKVPIPKVPVPKVDLNDNAAGGEEEGTASGFYSRSKFWLYDHEDLNKFTKEEVASFRRDAKNPPPRPLFSQARAFYGRPTLPFEPKEKKPLRYEESKAWYYDHEDLERLSEEDLQKFRDDIATTPKPPPYSRPFVNHPSRVVPEKDPIVYLPYLREKFWQYDHNDIARFSPQDMVRYKKDGREGTVPQRVKRQSYSFKQ